MMFAIPSNGVSRVFSVFFFFAQRCMNISWRILAHLSDYLIGQSLMVLSSTTELFMTSLPVMSETYLLLY
jgi:hypothetical protein